MKGNGLMKVMCEKSTAKFIFNAERQETFPGDQG